LSREKGMFKDESIFNIISKNKKKIVDLFGRTFEFRVKNKK